MRLSDIHIRDPFILPYGGVYYLYGTRGSTSRARANGFDVYRSRNLSEWEGPFAAFSAPERFWADRDFWAPEVHFYRGRFYMLASFRSPERLRGTQILVSDSPAGPFLPHSNGPVTPPDWECLDGTLYIAPNGKPYMVFSHEHTQVLDGQICKLPLSEDLSRASGEAEILFRASEPGWAIPGAERYVTDGPFMYRAKNGALLMLWSSFAASGYVEAVAVSESGGIDGPWTHVHPLLFKKDGGHGMIFNGFDGKLYLIFHTPNRNPDERPALIELEDNNGTLCLK
jgi:arabinan endo-1,5-alpha-L-arabinosidase